MNYRNINIVSKIVGLLCVVFLVTTLCPYAETKPPDQLPLHEAEILIYLLPPAVSVRAEGMEVGWELQDAKQYNTNFYVFWVYNARRENSGSVTIGYFAVNKRTANVWDLGLERFVDSKELAGVQRILRKAHHIDHQTIEKYGGQRPTQLN
jgi:hypothetical protein